MSGSEEASSLLSMEKTIAERLKRLDLDRGADYLASVRGVVDPFHDKVARARAEVSGLALRAAVAKDTAELRIINSQVAMSAADLFIALHSVQMVHELCTVVRDAIAERALELARRELSFSASTYDLPLALMAVGSDGRREHALFVDQDFLFVYGTNPQLAEEEIDQYFQTLGFSFMTRLDEIGIAQCSGGIMPVNPDWRGSHQQWQERLSSILKFTRSEWEKDIINVIALMDVRFVSGDHAVGDGFGTSIRSVVRQDSNAIRHIARVVSSMKLSKGFLRRFIVEAEGAHRGEFNLKVLAWMPLVMCVRLLAVELGIEETSTLGRLTCLRNGGHLSNNMTDDLIDAYHVITGYRIRQQIRKLKRIVDNDCYINPYELPNREREILKGAISSIEELQTMIRSRLSMAASADRMIPPLQQS